MGLAEALKKLRNSFEMSYHKLTLWAQLELNSNNGENTEYILYHNNIVYHL